MSPGSSPALGYQLSCCLAVKPFLTVTGKPKNRAGREVGSTQEDLPGTGASVVIYCMPCAAPAVPSCIRLPFRSLMALPARSSHQLLLADTETEAQAENLSYPMA